MHLSTSTLLGSIALALTLLSRPTAGSPVLSESPALAPANETYAALATRDTARVSLPVHWYDQKNLKGTESLTGKGTWGDCWSVDIGGTWKGGRVKSIAVVAPARCYFFTNGHCNSERILAIDQPSADKKTYRILDTTNMWGDDWKVATFKCFPGTDNSDKSLAKAAPWGKRIVSG